MVKAQEGPPVLKSQIGKMEELPTSGTPPAPEKPLPPPGGVRPEVPPPLGAEPAGPLPLPGVEQPGPVRQELDIGLLSNAPAAIKTAREAKKYFSSWKLWRHKGLAGEVIIKAAVIYSGVAISSLEFDPLTGRVLPKGYHPMCFESKIRLEEVRRELPKVVSELKVLGGAEFRDKERCWIVPLGYRGMIVAHVKVYQDGVHIVPDYPLDQEMRVYGR